jgi:hypothetical protein
MCSHDAALMIQLTIALLHFDVTKGDYQESLSFGWCAVGVGLIAAALGIISILVSNTRLLFNLFSKLYERVTKKSDS